MSRTVRAHLDFCIMVYKEKKPYNILLAKKSIVYRFSDNRYLKEYFQGKSLSRNRPDVKQKQCKGQILKRTSFPRQLLNRINQIFTSKF